MGRRYAQLALGLALALGARVAVATTIASNTVTVSTPDGSIVVASQLVDNFEGDPSRWTFEYSLSGNYDPIPGSTNGISSLQIFFGGLVGITDQMGPGGWIQNSTGASPPLGAGWDLPNSQGTGAGPSSGALLFSFTVPAGTAYTDADEGSYAASHFLDNPFAPVALIDDASALGPLVPAPEPGPALLVAAGAAALAGVRRRS